MVVGLCCQDIILVLACLLGWAGLGARGSTFLCLLRPKNGFMFYNDTACLFILEYLSCIVGLQAGFFNWRLEMETAILSQSDLFFICVRKDRRFSSNGAHDILEFQSYLP